ncbi:MAG: glutamate mutase L [Anaerolineae bacterium]|nr:glutamate mutase L [Anaerolineae bacterium]
MSDDNKPIESALVADIGSTLTHVCLIDQVEGIYRLIACASAPTTAYGAEGDITIGLRRAIEKIERIAQRPLLNREGEPISPEQDTGEGTDIFLATSSAAPPLECIIVGLTNDLSIQSAQRACATANAIVTHTIALGARGRRWDKKTLALLHQSPPDVILMVGGVDTGPTAPLESAARVLANIYEDINPEQRPVIVFAGNQEARRPVAAILGEGFDLRVVDNVRPNAHIESPGELQRELSDLYSQNKLATLPGYRRLRRWCSSAILSSSEALSITLRFIARRNKLPQGVLGIDVGGNTTYVGAARSEMYQWATSPNMGTSYGLRHVVKESGLRDIRRWLPFPMQTRELVSYLENASLRPQGVPQTMEDLLILHALARQALLLTMRRIRGQFWVGEDALMRTTPPFDLLAARGGLLSHTVQDGLTVLTILDAAQPTGLIRLVIDWASLWPQLGALAQVAPLAAAQVLERDGFRELGTIIAPIGEARDGDRALHLRIIRQDGQVTEADIPAGTIRRFPLGLNEQATVEVRPSRHFDIGLGRKGLGGKAQVRGGSLGIIIDTRGRPLGLPQDARRRRAKLQEWLGSLIHDDNSSS